MPLGKDVGLSPGDFVLDGDPSPLPNKGRSPLAQFSPHFYCSQTAGCVKMPLGTEVGLSPGDFVLDGSGDPAPIFGPCLVRPNGCIDQDTTWYGSRPRPDDIVLDGNPAPPPKKGPESPPQFSAHDYCGQTAAWTKMAHGTEVGLGQTTLYYMGTQLPSQKRRRSPLPNFRPMSAVAKRLHGSRWHLPWRWALVQATSCKLQWGPSSPPKKGAEPPHQFLADFYYCQTGECIKMPLGMEVGVSPGDFVLEWDSAPLPTKERIPQFLAHVYCGQTATWMKMSLGTAVGLGLRNIVLDGDTAPSPKGTQLHNFRPMFAVAKQLDGLRCHLVWR